MAELTSAVVVDLPAGILWAGSRIAGRGSGPLAVVTIRPAPANGFVVVEAVSECRAIALNLEVQNDAELPRPLAIYSADLCLLRRKNGSAERIRVETVSGADPGEGGLLALRSIGGTRPVGMLFEEAQPLDPLPLAGLPSPWWEPEGSIPAPILLNVERMRRMLHALEDAAICSTLELIVTANEPVVGIAVRAWGDEAPTGSLQLARCQEVPATGMR